MFCPKQEETEREDQILEHPNLQDNRGKKIFQGGAHRKKKDVQSIRKKRGIQNKKGEERSFERKKIEINRRRDREKRERLRQREIQKERDRQTDRETERERNMKCGREFPHDLFESIICTVYCLIQIIQAKIQCK